MDEFDVNDMSDECYDVAECEEEVEEEDNNLPFCGYKGRSCGYCNGCLT